MGLFDGIRGEEGRTGASADIAARLGWPVVLVIDVSGQAQSAAAVARGFALHDPAVRIADLREQLPSDVLEEYDAQRQENGVGAAQFKANRACGGCFIQLPPAERAEVLGEPEDELPTCPNCGTLLVRVSPAGE